MSTAGQTTVQYVGGSEVRSLSFVWGAIRRWLYPSDEESQTKVKGMKLTLDKKGAVFDVPSEDEGKVLEAKKRMEAEGRRGEVRCVQDVATSAADGAGEAGAEEVGWEEQRWRRREGWSKRRLRRQVGFPWQEQSLRGRRCFIICDVTMLTDAHYVLMLGWGDGVFYRKEPSSE